jgi:DNA-binding MarR family transcriptional regulator
MTERSLDDVFIFLIERTQIQMKRYANQALRDIGIEITPEQWAILKRISERAGVNQRELADLTFKDPASVTRTLDLLEKKGLVKRTDPENDRRAYHLYLTDAGTALVEKILPVAHSVRAKGMAGITETEFEQLKNVLNKIYQNYS